MASEQDATVPSRIVLLPLSRDDQACRLAVEKYTQSVRADAPWCPDNIEFIRRINLDSAVGRSISLQGIDMNRNIQFRQLNYRVNGKSLRGFSKNPSMPGLRCRSWQGCRPLPASDALPDMLAFGAIAKDIAASFDDYWNATIDGERVQQFNEPLTTAWQRFKASLMKVVPESQL